jgi:hypothetical protein
LTSSSDFSKIRWPEYGRWNGSILQNKSHGHFPTKKNSVRLHRSLNYIESHVKLEERSLSFPDWKPIQKVFEVQKPAGPPTVCASSALRFLRLSSTPSSRQAARKCVPHEENEDDFETNEHDHVLESDSD